MWYILAKNNSYSVYKIFKYVIIKYMEGVFIMRREWFLEEEIFG